MADLSKMKADANWLHETAKKFVGVNRVELIDNQGRVYVQYNVEEVQLHLQDDGRTLKIFLEYDETPDKEQ